MSDAANDARSEVVKGLPTTSTPRGEIERVREAAPRPAPLDLGRTYDADLREEAPSRARQWLILSFLALVIAPTVVGGLYLSLLASNRYVSEFRVAVRSGEPLKYAGFPALVGLTGNSQAGNDSQAVVQYLQSREPLDELERRLELRARYQRESIDWWSRLPPDSPIEAVVRYWRKMVDAYFEASTGTIIVKVSAFSPSDAYEIASNALSLSEALVNRMSARTRSDALAASQREVESSQKRLAEVDEKLRVLRDSEKILDPRKAAEANLALAAKLSAQIADLKAQLDEQRKTLSDTAPSVEVNLRRLEALEGELVSVKGQMTADPNSARPLTSVIGAFDELESEAKFAEKAYQSAMASLESARMDADRQQIYLATIVRPAVPQEPSYPRPIIGALTIFGIAAMAWSIGVLVIQAVRDHL